MFIIYVAWYNKAKINHHFYLKYTMEALIKYTTLLELF